MPQPYFIIDNIKNYCDRAFGYASQVFFFQEQIQLLSILDLDKR